MSSSHLYCDLHVYKQNMAISIKTRHQLYCGGVIFIVLICVVVLLSHILMTLP